MRRAIALVLVLVLATITTIWLAGRTVAHRTALPPRTAAQPSDARSPSSLDRSSDAPRDVVHAPRQDPIDERVRVTVLTRVGAACTGAEVFIGDGVDANWVGTTDPEGRVEFALAPGRWDEILARMAGSATVVQRRPDGLRAGDDLVLRLEGSSTIRGRVQWTDGTSAGEGLDVLAIPPRIADDPMRATRECLFAHPAVARTLTRADGTFELRDTRGSDPYLLIAGGRGLIVPEFPVAVRSGTVDAVVTIGAVFGIRVLFTEADGTPAHLGPVWQTRGTPWSCTFENQGCAPISSAEVLARVAGIDSESLGQTDAELTFLFACPTRSTPAASAVLRGRPPGYAPYIGEVPLAVGIAPHVCVLERTSPGFGTVELVLEDHDDAVTSRLDAVGAVHFEAESSGERFKLPVFEGPRATTRFDDVPFGAYRVRFERAPGLTTFPPADQSALTTTVGPVPARIEIGALPRNALEIDVRSRDGTPWTGTLSLLIGRRPPKELGEGRSSVSGRVVDFLRAPYLLTGIDPGNYTVLVTSGAFGNAPATVVVKREGTTRLSVRANE